MTSTTRAAGLIAGSAAILAGVGLAAATVATAATPAPPSSYTVQSGLMAVGAKPYDRPSWANQCDLGSHVRGTTERDSENGTYHFFPAVQAQLRFARSAVRSMTSKAVLCKDGTDVAVVFELTLRTKSAG